MAETNDGASQQPLSPVPAAVPAHDATNTPIVLPMEFTGEGAEYFRIWIVNWALSIVTVGLYSPWAKVRREKYFYQNTWLAESNFDYTGQPFAILKGRLLVAALVITWQVAQRFMPFVAGLIFLIGLLVFPWLVVSALRFRMHNTRYRGLRFRFHGTKRGAAVTYMLWAVIHFGIFYPSFAWRKARYLISNIAFGSARFGFKATSGSFYRVYYPLIALSAILLVVVGGPLWMLGATVISGMRESPVAAIGVIAVVASIWILAVRFVMALVDAEKFRLCFNGLVIGPHRVDCALKTMRYAWVAAYGMLLTLLTLTLYKPRMDIALARMRVESLSVYLVGSLDSIVADASAQRSATGDEAADLLGFDLGI